MLLNSAITLQSNNFTIKNLYVKIKQHIVNICRFHTKDGNPSETSFPSVTSFSFYCEIGTGRVFDRKLVQIYPFFYSSIQTSKLPDWTKNSLKSVTISYQMGFRKRVSDGKSEKGLEIEKKNIYLKKNEFHVTY